MNLTKPPGAGVPAANQAVAQISSNPNIRKDWSAYFFKILTDKYLELRKQGFSQEDAMQLVERASAVVRQEARKTALRLSQEE